MAASAFKTKFVGMPSEVKEMYRKGKHIRYDKHEIHTQTFVSRSFNMLYSHGVDSTVVVAFLANMKFHLHALLYLVVDVFEFVLRQANEARYNLWTLSDRDMINDSILNHMFVKTESLLKYRDAPRFCAKAYRELKRKGRSDSLKKGPEDPVANGQITKQRHFLILQILDVFQDVLGDCGGCGLKALQILWRSIPDPFITVDELISVFSEQENSRFIKEFCSFIEDVTGEQLTEERRCQPRKLKHNCRTVIRRALSNNFRLSTGIDELNLPPSVADYLRLQH